MGANLDSIRVATVPGDSIKTPSNEGNLVLADTDCQHVEADGVCVIMFNDAPLVMFVSADVDSRKICVRSDNKLHEPQLAAEIELTICGRVQACLPLLEH